MTTVLLMAAWAFAEDGQDSAAETQPSDAAPQIERLVVEDGFVLFPDREGGFLEGSPYLAPYPNPGRSPFYQDSVARFGWWGVHAQGSPSGVGEWTGLNSTAFWDVDSLTSDGSRTVDFALSGPMDETTDLHWYLYSPLLTADVDMQRFIHRSATKPLDAWFNTPGSGHLVGTDLNDTTDHAIRIQELEADFSGQLTENSKWHMGVWGMRKFGERQKIAMDHNCSDRECHQVTQSQSINWLTMEISPGIEVDLGPVTFDYTRTMRAFEQNDEIVSRSYHGRPADFAVADQVAPYGIVPENFTAIDKLKIGADLSENHRFYTNMFRGNTHNRNRDTNRGFWGLDMRLTDSTFDNLRMTGYAKYYEQFGDLPTVFPEDGLFVNPPSAEVRHPVNRQWLKTGLKGRWKPLRDSYRWRGLALTSGYEYKQLERQNASYDITGAGPDPVTFTQPNTFTHEFKVGSEMRWSSSFDSYLRYRMVTAADPLFGVRESDENVTDEEIAGGFGTSGVTALNTNQPRQEDRVELGGTWSPTYNFMLSAMFGLEVMNHGSNFASFKEDNFPITVTGWYAPTPSWSVSGALGFYQNNISQDITYGNGHTSNRGDEAQDLLTTDFTGKSDVITLGTHHVLTRRLTFNGDFQFVRGRNTWFVPDGMSVDNPPVPVDYTSLPTFSAVIVETTRFGAGLDYELADNTTCYFKYMFYDYNDKSGAILSGSYHMFLGGLAARF